MDAVVLVVVELEEEAVLDSLEVVLEVVLEDVLDVSKVVVLELELVVVGEVL